MTTKTKEERKTRTLTTKEQRKLSDIAARIRALHKAVVRTMRQGLRHAMEAGEQLQVAKDSRLIRHGQWEDWVEQSAMMSSRTASMYMRLWKHRATLESATIADLELTITDALRLITEAAPRTKLVRIETTTETVELTPRYSQREPEQQPATVTSQQLRREYYQPDSSSTREGSPEPAVMYLSPPSEQFAAAFEEIERRITAGDAVKVAGTLHDAGWSRERVEHVAQSVLAAWPEVRH